MKNRDQRFYTGWVETNFSNEHGTQNQSRACFSYESEFEADVLKEVMRQLDHLLPVARDHWDGDSTFEVDLSVLVEGGVEGNVSASVTMSDKCISDFETGPRQIDEAGFDKSVRDEVPDMVRALVTRIVAAERACDEGDVLLADLAEMKESGPLSPTGRPIVEVPNLRVLLKCANKEEPPRLIFATTKGPTVSLEGAPGETLETLEIEAWVRMKFLSPELRQLVNKELDRTAT